MITTSRALYLGIALALAACGSKSPTAPTKPTAASPADPKLAKIYDQTCKACHSNPASGAPLAGDAKAWTPRTAQGMDVLMQHAINGYKGMPPLGSCMDCSEDELRALIKFMAGAQ